jgi:4-hydroxybenzoate polyprenyltransferase
MPRTNRSFATGVRRIELPAHRSEPPLCVDLDGTLIRSDLLWESLVCFFCQHPARFPLVFVWLLKGSAHLKRRLAENTVLDVALLPFNETFVAWLRGRHAAGRRLILATAADEILATRVAAYLGIFDEVLSSDGINNLKGRKKAALLSAKIAGAFDYAGNSTSDWEIWRLCRRIIAVETPRWLTRRLTESGRLAESFRTPKSRLGVRLRALRIQQWVKNILIFVPIIAAHKVLDPRRLVPALICFTSFSLVASAAYLGNDLLDLASDRMHPRKRFRAIAAGDLSIPLAATWSAALFTAGIGLAMTLDTTIVPILIVLYIAASFAYSLHLKKIALLDVFVLSGFYTLRIVAGGAAGHVPLSGWFLSFSVFLFLSLGFAKRAVELRRTETFSSPPQLPGRGYVAADLQTIVCFGIAAAFAAALVLSLYFQSTDVRALYRYPALLWALFPVCLYWLTRVWLLASRGALHDDPVTFAVGDRTTWLVLGYCATVLRLAA